MKDAKSFSPIVIFVLIILGGWALLKLSPAKVEAPTPSSESKVELQPEILNSINSNSQDSPSENKTKMPESASVENVPLVVQAPNGEWDEIHEDACEEAAALTVSYYLQGNKEVDTDKMEQDIQDLVQFEKDNFDGLWKSTTASETARFIEKKWGYKVDLKYDISLDDIKTAIAQGNLVLLPANGQELKNPHYKQPGPLYHFVVAIGYTENQIITNDPGTKFGKDYIYDNDVLLNALGDWNGTSGDGRKVMLVLEK
jgi:hypothetical protein